MRILAVILGLIGSSAQAQCLIPWGVTRSDSSSCAARVRIRDEQGAIRVCMERKLYLRWLHQEESQLWRVDSRVPLRRIRPPALDQRAGPPQRWGVAVPGVSCSAGWWDRASLAIIRKVERQREFWSERIAPSDPTGWLRSWVVGERVRERAGSLPASVLFSLGFVHLLTSAGVHLVFLSRVFRGLMGLMLTGLDFSIGARHVVTLNRLLLVLEGALFLWVWMLAGMRWGMLRPLFLVALSRTFSRTNWAIRAPIPLILGVLLELLLESWTVEAGWGLAPESEFVSHGRWHYLAAVWGGVWGARHLEVSVGSWLWVIPLQVMHDRSLSLINPLLSLLTIPIAGVLLLPLSLLGFVFPALIPLVGSVSQAVLAALVPLSLLPWANWQVELWALLPGLLGAGLVYFFWGERRNFGWVIAGVGLGLGLGLVLFWLRSASSPGSEGAERVIQLDVGQGDATLVLGKNWAGFVDAGPERAGTQAAWLSVFSRHGVTALDWVVLTHLDEDHVGGLRQWVRWVPIRCVVIPPALWESPKAIRLRQWASLWGVRIQPYPQGCFPWGWAALRGSALRANSGMVGVRIPLSRGGEYWNLGDASTRGASLERELFEQLQARVPESQLGGTKILKLSHHGSRFSSAREFLRVFQPTEVWVSAGFSNRYGHPHGEVLERLSELRIPWRSTARTGAIHSKTDEFRALKAQP